MDYTATVSDGELLYRSIAELIDRTDCEFQFDRSEMTGYLFFEQMHELNYFLDELGSLKSNLWYLNQCWEAPTYEH